MKTIMSFIGVAICTVLLYHLIYEEHTTLFYINVVVTWLAEGILLLNIPVFSNSKILNFKSAASITVLNIAAIILFLWTVSYSAFVEDPTNLDNFYIGLLVITIMSICAFSITEIGGGVMRKQETELTKIVQNKKRLLVSYNNYWLEAKECLRFNSEWESNILSQYRSALDKVESIPAEKLERNVEIVRDIDDKLKEVLGEMVKGRR